ncbi:putative serine/threonine-protein kinase-like, partial [Tropilaelaps mercedesae]
MDVLELSPISHPESVEGLVSSISSPPSRRLATPCSSQDVTSIIKKARARSSFCNRRRSKVRFDERPISEHCTSFRGSPANSTLNRKGSTFSKDTHVVNRSVGGVLTPRHRELNGRRMNSTIYSDGQQDCHQDLNKSFSQPTTSLEINNGSLTEFVSDVECVSPTYKAIHTVDNHGVSGGRQNASTRVGATRREKTGEIQLRREVSDFIKQADLDIPSAKKNATKEPIVVLDSVKDPSMSSSSSLPEVASTTWNKFIRGMRTIMACIFVRRRPDTRFKSTSIWVNPEYADEFDLTSGSMSMCYKIGSGSYGVVYLVEHKETWKKYAIKCVRKRTGKRRLPSIENCETEFHVWRKTAGHPNIISLIAAFQTRSAFCFVMDYVSTGNLSHLLSRQDKPLRDEDVRRIASQLAHALYTVHRLGFLHRDVSCSNVLVTSKRNVLLIDFGSSVVGHTATTRAGTLAYMAPEVLAGRAAGPGADWWSYGIVLFALFEGTTPMHIYANRYKLDLRRLSLRSRFAIMKRVSVPISPLLQTDRKNLLKDFLREEPKARLGVRRKQDFNLIKQHAYFARVNWRTMDEALEKMLRKKYDSLGHGGFGLGGGVGYGAVFAVPAVPVQSVPSIKVGIGVAQQPAVSTPVAYTPAIVLKPAIAKVATSSVTIR